MVVVAGAGADALLLGRGDEDCLDQVAVPHRLEKRVREPEREHVLDGVLGEVVIDAEDLLLVERGCELKVELSRGCEVVAERLLDHDPARGIALRRHSGVSDRSKDVGEGLGRRGEVEDRRSAAVDQRLDRCEAGGVLVVELNPFGGRCELAAPARRVDQVAELLLRRAAASRPDDAEPRAVARGQVPQRRQDLASREIARRSEDDEVDH